MKKEVYSKWLSGINDSYPIYAKVVKDILGIKEETYTMILSNDECKLTMILSNKFITNDFLVSLIVILYMQRL